MLKATKALFDDFNTDKNIHLLRTAGAGQAKRLGEFQPTLALVLPKLLCHVLQSLHVFQQY